MKKFNDADIIKILKEAAANKSLVLFVGTGVSMNAGAPNWEGFAINVLNQLSDKEIINHAFIDQIKDFSPKRKLSLAKTFAQKKNFEIDYKAAIEPKEKKESRIFDVIKRLNSCFVTTNYDPYLHEGYIDPLGDNSKNNVIKRTVFYRVEDLKKEIIEPGNVIHLHGSYKDGNKNLVVTIEDYITHYNKSKVQEFLGHLFTEDYTIVFVGYSLEEIEILDYLFLKSQNEKGLIKNSKNKRFWLQGYFSHYEDANMGLKEYYKDTFNIEVLLYTLDHNKFEELTNILQVWVDAINSKLTPSIRKKAFLDEIIENV